MPSVLAKAIAFIRQRRPVRADAFALAACLSLAYHAAARAEDIVAREGRSLLETLTVTGTRLRAASSRLSTEVSVIDYDVLTRLNKNSLTDVLRGVAGVHVSQQGGPGGVTNVHVRGGESNFGIVMLDGVQVNDPTNSRGGSFDFSGIDVDSIERIEIVRGPQSAIYGADALAGVINIVTREGSADVEHAARSSIGAHGYYHLGYQLTGSSQDRSTYALGINHRDHGEPVSGSQRELTTLTGKVAHRLGDNTRLESAIYFSTGERESFPEDSGGPQFAVSRQVDVSKNEDAALGAALIHQFGRPWLATVRGSWYQRTDETDSPGIFPFLDVPPNVTHIDFERVNLSWVNVIAVTPGVSASLGIDLEAERGESDGFVDFLGFQVPTAFEMDRNTYGYFAEIQAVFDHGPSLNWSVRRDDPDASGAETTQRIGMRYELESRRTTLRINWGEGFKLPSFFALGHALVGNPNLKPERSESYDLGVTQLFGEENASLTLSFFHNDFEDLIDFDPEAFTNVNRGRVETRGMELRSEIPVSAQLRMVAHMTYLDIDVLQENVKLRGRPRWKAGAQAQWQLRPDVAINLDYQWVDEVYEASRHSGASVLSRLDAYHRVDVNLSWRPLPNLELQLAVDNLLDEKYAEAVGFPAAGIQPRVSVRLSL